MIRDGLYFTSTPMPKCKPPKRSAIGLPRIRLNADNTFSYFEVNDEGRLERVISTFAEYVSYRNNAIKGGEEDSLIKFLRDERVCYASLESKGKFSSFMCKWFGIHSWKSIKKVGRHERFQCRECSKQKSVNHYVGGYQPVEQDLKG